MYKATSALVRKDLLISLRKPAFFILSLAIPLFFVTVYALVTFVSATNPVAIARESNGPYSDQLVQTLSSMKNVDGKWYEVKTTDPEEARNLYETGQVPAVITIPGSFDDQIAQGGKADVRLKVYNINSDGTKNLQLRLAHAVHLFEREVNPNNSISVDERTVFPAEVPFQRYWATALLVFAVIYVSSVNAGSLLAREWEERTAKSVVLSPSGFRPLIFGKWTTALLQALLGTLLVLIPLAVVMGLPVLKLGPTSWLYLLAFALYGSAIGAVLGVAFKSSLQIIPVATIIAVAHLLLCGLEIYLRGIAQEGFLLWFWWISSIIPVSGIIDAMRLSIEGFPASSYAAAGLSTGVAWRPLGWLLVLTAALTTYAVWLLRRRLKFTQGA